jgi:enoyl-CoA hydratase/carnithine racemase
MPDLVRLDVDEGVGIVRLDRPPANAISLQLSIDLLAALDEAGSRDDVGALVLWGGPKLFAAGADIKEMVDHGPDEIREQVTKLGDACELLESMPKVSIAAITGFALGGGFELSLACDLRYAAEDAKMGQPEIGIGVIPGAGGTQRMTWLAGVGVSRDLTYTGRHIEAEEAKALRLVERVVPADRVLATAVEDARAFARGPRRALAAGKEAILEAVRHSGREGITRERDLFVSLFGTDDQREGMRAFIEKRPPRFRGN